LHFPYSGCESRRPSVSLLLVVHCCTTASNSQYICQQVSCFVVFLSLAFSISSLSLCYVYIFLYSPDERVSRCCNPAAAPRSFKMNNSPALTEPCIFDGAQNFGRSQTSHPPACNNEILNPFSLISSAHSNAGPAPFLYVRIAPAAGRSGQRSGPPAAGGLKKTHANTARFFSGGKNSSGGI
jgi:hypothetical protein